MKILIVEDEFIIAQSLYSTLEKFDHEVYPICSTYNEAKTFLKQEKPDVIIIDIKLKGSKSGIDLAETLNETYSIPFIFLTSLTDVDLLNTLKYLNPSGILIKPYNPHELNATLNLVKHKSVIKRDKLVQQFSLDDGLFIKQKTEHIKIMFSDILYIKSNDVYLTIKTVNNQSIRIRATLDAYLKKLNTSFSRVHRSFIVNLSHIDKVYKEHLLIQADIIPIGNTYKPNILKTLNIN